MWCLRSMIYFSKKIDMNNSINNILLFVDNMIEHLVLRKIGLVDYLLYTHHSGLDSRILWSCWPLWSLQSTAGREDRRAQPEPLTPQSRKSPGYNRMPSAGRDRKLLNIISRVCNIIVHVDESIIRLVISVTCKVRFSLIWINIFF